MNATQVKQVKRRGGFGALKARALAGDHKAAQRLTEIAQLGAARSKVVSRPHRWNSEEAREAATISVARRQERRRRGGVLVA